MTELLPCPCCGSQNVFQWTNYQEAKCRDCKMRGPIKSWNDRVRPALTEPELLRIMAGGSPGPNPPKIVAILERYAEITRAKALAELPLDHLVRRAEDCRAEITRRSLLAINGPKS